MNHTPGFHYIFNMRDLSRVFQVCRHSLMCGCGMAQTWDPLLSPFFSAPPAIWPLFVDENPWDALCGYSTLGGQYWKCVRVSFRSFPKVTECHHHWMHCSTPSNGNKCPWQLVDRNDGNEKVNCVSHGSKQLSILVPWGMSSDNTNNLSTGRPSVVLYFMSTSHSKGTHILTTRDNLGPLGLGSLGTLSAVSDFRPPLPSLPGNYGMPCERGKHAVHLGGSLEAWMLLNCMKPPCSVTTSQQSQQFSEESSGDRLNTMESPNWFLHVPTSYEHQTTLVFPSVDVEWCRYITILSLLIPPKSTHYPRIGWKKCRETHCFMDKTSIPDQPSGPCRVEPESAQGQRVFADKLCRDVDKNLVESPGGKQGGMGWMVLVSPNRWKNPTLNGKTARCWW